MDYRSLRSLRSTPSQETLVSLLQLEPTPITDKELPPLPEESEHHVDGSESMASSADLGHARTTSSLGLSGSAANGSIYYRTSSLVADQTHWARY